MSPEGNPRAQRVLLAEDDDQLRSLFASGLRAAGLEVIEARDGVEVLDRLGLALVDSLDLDSIDLVVSDIHMPGVLGTEILEGLSAADCRKPFILITAFGDDGTRRNALACGAAAVLDKPLDVSVLRDVVVKTLSTHPARRARAEEAP